MGQQQSELNNMIQSFMNKATAQPILSSPSHVNKPVEVINVVDSNANVPIQNDPHDITTLINLFYHVQSPVHQLFCYDGADKATTLIVMMMKLENKQYNAYFFNFYPFSSTFEIPRSENFKSTKRSSPKSYMDRIGKQNCTKATLTPTTAQYVIDVITNICLTTMFFVFTQFNAMNILNLIVDGMTPNYEFIDKWVLPQLKVSKFLKLFNPLNNESNITFAKQRSKVYRLCYSLAAKHYTNKKNVFTLEAKRLLKVWRKTMAELLPPESDFIAITFVKLAFPITCS